MYEEALLARKAVVGDNLDSLRLKPVAQPFEVGDAKRRMAPRNPILRRRSGAGDDVQLLRTTCQPCARTPCIRVGGTVKRRKTKKPDVKPQRLAQRLVPVVNLNRDVIESNDVTHGASPHRCLIGVSVWDHNTERVKPNSSSDVARGERMNRGQFLENDSVRGFLSYFSVALRCWNVTYESRYHRIHHEDRHFA